MRNELWVMCAGAILAITVISTLSILVITNQRAEVTTLRNQVVTQAGTIANLNSSLAVTNDRLTSLAQKANPFIGAECHVDQVFNRPEDVPKGYKGYVFVEERYPTFDNYGIGVICR